MQFGASLSDSRVQAFQSDFDRWASAIKEQIDILVASAVRDSNKNTSSIHTHVD
jgi:uncharacterized protein YukE